MRLILSEGMAVQCTVWARAETTPPSRNRCLTRFVVSNLCAAICQRSTRRPRDPDVVPSRAGRRENVGRHSALDRLDVDDCGLAIEASGKQQAAGAYVTRPC
ncbi:hypothetical protein ACN47E_007570 [Coniothyrium glycines]